MLFSVTSWFLKHTYINIKHIKQQQQEDLKDQQCFGSDLFSFRPPGSDLFSFRPPGSDLFSFRPPGSDLFSFRPPGSDLFSFRPPGSVIHHPRLYFVTFNCIFNDLFVFLTSIAIGINTIIINFTTILYCTVHFMYSVMRSDWNRICEDVVLNSFNII